jgi:hypothetical protein
MDTAQFELVYGGSAFNNNEMDIRELVPALMSISDLLEEANEVINGNTSKVSVNVAGRFKSGSFGIDLSVHQDIIQDILKIFSSDQMAGAVNILQLLGFLGLSNIYGLIQLIKKLNNKKIQKVIELDNNQIEIQISPIESYKTDSRVIKLYRNSRIRSSLERVITEPLQRDGVEYVKFVDIKNQKEIIISKEDKDLFFTPKLEDEILGENESTAYVQVVAISFKGGNMWRFSRSGVEFFALIQDQEFIKKIDNHEIQFGKDDIMHVRLNAKDYLTERGLRTEYKIIEVIEFRPAARQLPLPMVTEE